MRNTASTDASETKDVDCISISQRADIWRIALNGDFYGDYSRKSWALEAAFEKADALARLGRAATITRTDDSQQNALLYDTRRPTLRKNIEQLSEKHLLRPLR